MIIMSLNELPRVSLKDAITWARSNAGFTKAAFYIEVEVCRIIEQDVITTKGILSRLKIRDKSAVATLVVWGSKDNQRNLEVIRSRPKRIRIIQPVAPTKKAAKQYEVHLWAHEKYTKIEIIE